MTLGYLTSERGVPVDTPVAAVPPPRLRLYAFGSRPPFGAYLRQLWQMRYFIWLLGISKGENLPDDDKNSTFWNIAEPVMHAARFILIFGLVLYGHQEVNPIAFVVVGIFTWDFFESCIMSNFRVIKGNKNIIASYSFPRAIVVIGAVLASAFKYRYDLLIMLICVAASGLIPGMLPMLPTLRWFAAIPAFLLIIIWGIGAACIAARIGTFLPQIRSFLTLPMIFLRVSSGVMFSAALFVPMVGQRTIDYIALLPGAVFVYLMRSSLLQDPLFPPSVEMWLLGIAWSIATFVFGLAIFWFGEHEYGKKARLLVDDSLHKTLETLA